MTTVTNNTPVFSSEALTTKAMLVSLTIKQPSNSKKDKSATDELVADRHARDGAIRVNKSLFNKEAVEWFSKPASEARQALVEMTLPWEQKGTRILLATNYFRLVKSMENYRHAFEAGRDKFLDQLDDLINQARKELGTLFNEDDYPTKEELEEKFSFNVAFNQITDGNDWRVSLGGEEEDKLREQITNNLRNQAITSAQDAWNRVRDAISALALRIEERVKDEKAGEGRKTPVRPALITNLAELGDALPGLNVLGDPRLDQVAQEIKDLVSGLSADDLKDNLPLQERVSTDARALEQKVAQYQAYFG